MILEGFVVNFAWIFDEFQHMLDAMFGRIPSRVFDSFERKMSTRKLTSTIFTMTLKVSFGIDFRFFLENEKV